MEYRILGPLEVGEGGGVVDLGGPKPRALLAALLVHAGETVSTDRLIDALWCESPPRTAHHLLHVYVSNLRKALGSGAVVSRAPGYLVQLEGDQLDARRFERLLDAGRAQLRAGDPGHAAPALAQALALWRGPALADFVYEPFAQAQIARLEELRLVALEERLEADLALGRHAEAVAELEQLVAEHPVRERPRGQLMLALYRCGRQAEALETYRETRRVLVDELGIEPSPPLQRLHDAILNQDEELDVAAQAPPAPTARKLVTVVVASLAGGDGLDPEARSALSARALDAAGAALAAHGATVRRSFAESVMGVFGVPAAGEDDALRAVTAALSIGDAAGIGVETGEVVVEGESVAGEALSVAMRLSQAAAPGHVLLGETNQRLVGHAVVADGGRAVALVPDAPALPRRFGSPLVGRERELERLRLEFRQAAGERALRLVTVVGDAGVGKSRLARELVAAVADEATVLVGSCIAHGEGITFWPLREVVRQAAGEEWREGLLRLLETHDAGETVAARILAAMGAQGAAAGSPEETSWAFRVLLETIAAGGPLLVVLEDIHWGEPAFLDFLEYLRRSAGRVAILVLCLARPELLEERPSWPDAATLALEPLAGPAATALVEHLAPVPREARERIVATGEGNPLFLEQITAMFAEGKDAAALPPTVQAVLAARLDRLGPAQRAVLERAAVQGRWFSRAGVEELLPAAARPFLSRHLQELTRKEYINADGGLRFRHILIQEAAYRTIPKRLRAELHEQLAGWLLAQGAEHEEIVGYHLEQAAGYLAELGTPAPELAGRAARHLWAAGRRASGRIDFNAAINLLERAAALLPDDDTAAVLQELGAALNRSMQQPRAEPVLTLAIERAARAGDWRTEVRARLDRWWVRLHLETGLSAELVEEVNALIPSLEELGDDLGLTKAWQLLAWRDWTACRFGDMRRHLERALPHARRGADRLEETEIVMLSLDTLYLGPTPVPEAIESCADARGAADRDLRIEVMATRTSAAMHAMLGRFDEARRLIAYSESVFDKVGLDRFRPWFEPWQIELLAGDTAAAERWLSYSAENLEPTSNALVSLFGAARAHIACEQGRYEEALALSEDSGVRASDWVVNQVMWRSAAAKASVHLGRAQAALALGREAVALAQQTDALNMHGDALMDLAEVLGVVGQAEEAAARVGEALALYERKGNLVMAGRARARLAGAGAASGA